MLEIDTVNGKQRVACVARLQGLAVTQGWGLHEYRWRVTHGRTGMALPGSFGTKDEAVAYMRLMAPLARWGAIGADGVHDGGVLGDAARALAYACGDDGYSP